MLELAGIIILGILAQWVAWKFKIPAILPLILIGLLVGPIAAAYLSEDGSKWIEPIWNGSKGLFPGEGLYYFVSLAISVILFEGGLTLKKDEIKNVGPVITKLITLGSAVTFFGAGIITHYIFELNWELFFSFFRINYRYWSDSDYTNSKKYSIKKRCFYSVKMGRDFN